MELADRYQDDTESDETTRLTAKQKARGRDATTPAEIPAKGWKDILLRVKGEISSDHVGLIAAGCAFYGLMAVFPAITALMALTGLLLDPDQMVSTLEGVSSLVPNDVSTILLDQATEVAGSQTGGLTLGLVFGLGLALWSASAGVGSLMEGLNVAYDEKEERGFIKLKALTILLTLAMVIGVLVAAGLIVALPIVLNVLAFAPWVETLISLTRFLPLALLFLVGLAVLYRYGPDRDNAELVWITPGAILSLVLWMIMSIGFSYYVSNFGSYNETFGSLAGVIVLLTWMWLSAYIVLLGAEVNAEMEAQTARDTTVGPDEPMGQRGAEKADELGAAQ
ncbi:YihY/virulence factor BrkB family protein [Jannaschia sp.]|nr:YihY/virulence factor BrkB family protein [Jannaschia sp.]